MFLPADFVRLGRKDLKIFRRIGKTDGRRTWFVNERGIWGVDGPDGHSDRQFGHVATGGKGKRMERTKKNKAILACLSLAAVAGSFAMLAAATVLFSGDMTLTWVMFIAMGIGYFGVTGAVMVPWIIESEVVNLVSGMVLGLFAAGCLALGCSNPLMEDPSGWLFLLGWCIGYLPILLMALIPGLYRYRAA